MKLQTLFIATIITLSATLLVFGCENILQNSGLPKQMPDNVEMNFDENGGMSPASKGIKVSGKTLLVEQRTMQENESKSWTAEISDADKKALYQAFVDNKFDLIKNEENTSITYDAPSEGIYITFGGKSYRTSYGANSPLSMFNLKRYRNVRAAFEKLEESYKGAAKQPDQNYAVIKFDAKMHDFIFKSARNADLHGIEFAELDNLIRKAVDKHNSKEKKYGIIRDLSEYKFQYIPVYNQKNEKEVWVNVFCDSFEIDWKKQIVDVDDGGSCFFNLKINLTKSNTYDLQVNGEG